jgi:hypothetical protein
MTCQCHLKNEGKHLMEVKLLYRLGLPLFCPKGDLREVIEAQRANEKKS